MGDAMINISRVQRMIEMFSCPLSDVCCFMRGMSWLEKISHYEVIISGLARRLLTSPCLLSDLLGMVSLCQGQSQAKPQVTVTTTIGLSNCPQ